MAGSGRCSRGSSPSAPTLTVATCAVSPSSRLNPFDASVAKLNAAELYPPPQVPFTPPREPAAAMRTALAWHDGRQRCLVVEGFRATLGGA